LPIPTYDALMLPVLRHCAEKLWQMRELTTRIADDLALTQDERNQLLPSGGSTVIASRVAWAKTYLKQAGLLEQPKRSVVQISERGREFLKTAPEKIDSKTLLTFDDFRAFQNRTKSSGQSVVSPVPATAATIEASSTPEEQIDLASNTLDELLRDSVLARMLESSPAFFEKIIVDLLLAMGYGGSRADAGEQLGGTGDGGVDGLIREDQLGLDRVYLQAKRYKPGNTVTSETVRAFIGALVGKGAHKGVLITTSTFSKDALTAANQSGSLRIVLIDGDALTKLMVRFNVGVRVKQTVEIKRIDLEYFGDTETE
jgi:restriction system protein